MPELVADRSCATGPRRVSRPCWIRLNCLVLTQVLRFANLLFEPLWNRKYIRNVQVGPCS